MKRVLLTSIVILIASGVLAQSVPPAGEKLHISVILKTDMVVYMMDEKTANFDKVENLMRAMPSFTIGADGAITHYGEPIYNLTINGEKYAGLSMLKVIQRLPVAAVQNIELIDDYGRVTRETFQHPEPDKRLNINTKPDAINDIDFYLSNRPSRPMDGRRGRYNDPALYGDINHINEHNPLDRHVNRAIRNMLAANDRIGEVDEFGDQVPHFIIQLKYPLQNNVIKGKPADNSQATKTTEQKP